MTFPAATRKALVLISAQQQVGKDTLAKAMAYRAQALVVGLADPVKEVAIAMLGMPPSIAYGGEDARRSWKRYGKDAREWLRHIGTEIGRGLVDPHVWIHRLAERVQATAHSTIIVKDVRFGNELATLGSPSNLRNSLKLIGLDYQLTFDPIVTVRVRRAGKANTEGHASESEQLGIPDSAFDEVVENDGSPKDLKDKGEEIYRKYLAQ